MLKIAPQAQMLAFLVLIYALPRRFRACLELDFHTFPESKQFLILKIFACGAIFLVYDTYKTSKNAIFGEAKSIVKKAPLKKYRFDLRGAFLTVDFSPLFFS